MKFAVTAVAIDRSDRVNDPAGLERESLGRFGITGVATSEHAARGLKFRQYAGSGRLISAVAAGTLEFHFPGARLETNRRSPVLHPDASAALDAIAELLDSFG